MKIKSLILLLCVVFITSACLFAAEVSAEVIALDAVLLDASGQQIG